MQVLAALGLSRNASGWIVSSNKIIVDECRHEWKAGDRFIRKSGEGDVIIATFVESGNVYYGSDERFHANFIPIRAVSRIRNAEEVAKSVQER